MTSADKMPELKPCPFCGDAHEEPEFQIGTPDREGVPTNVICPDCGGAGPWVYCSPSDWSSAVKEWNARADRAVPESVLTALRFYSSLDNWNRSFTCSENHVGGNPSKIDRDFGNVARKALRDLGVEP